MRFLCIKVSNKLIIALLLFSILVMLISVDFINIQAKAQTVKTNEDRVEYLQSLGYEVKHEYVTTKEIIIPNTFGEIYKDYNKLQISAGFDLMNFRGKKVDFYSYKILNAENLYANLLICDNILIGGDISSSEISGNMYPLQKRSKNENIQT